MAPAPSKIEVKNTENELMAEINTIDSTLVKLNQNLVNVKSFSSMIDLNHNHNNYNYNDEKDNHLTSDDSESNWFKLVETVNIYNDYGHDPNTDDNGGYRDADKSETHNIRYYNKNRTAQNGSIPTVIDCNLLLHDKKNIAFIQLPNKGTGNNDNNDGSMFTITAKHDIDIIIQLVNAAIYSNYDLPNAGFTKLHKHSPLVHFEVIQQDNNSSVKKTIHELYNGHNFFGSTLKYWQDGSSGTYIKQLKTGETYKLPFSNLDSDTDNGNLIIPIVFIALSNKCIYKEINNDSSAFKSNQTIIKQDKPESNLENIDTNFPNNDTLYKFVPYKDLLTASGESHPTTATDVGNSSVFEDRCFKFISSKNWIDQYTNFQGDANRVPDHTLNNPAISIQAFQTLRNIIGDNGTISSDEKYVHLNIFRETGPNGTSWIPDCVVNNENIPNAIYVVLRNNDKNIGVNVNDNLIGDNGVDKSPFKAVIGMKCRVIIEFWQHQSPGILQQLYPTNDGLKDWFTYANEKLKAAGKLGTALWNAVSGEFFDNDNNGSAISDPDIFKQYNEYIWMQARWNMINANDSQCMFDYMLNINGVDQVRKLGDGGGNIIEDERPLPNQQGEHTYILGHELDVNNGKGYWRTGNHAPPWDSGNTFYKTFDAFETITLPGNANSTIGNYHLFIVGLDE